MGHAIDTGQLKLDPSIAIRRPKTKEIRAWIDTEMVAFERRWPIGTKQRTAYLIMLKWFRGVASSAPCLARSGPVLPVLRRV